MDITEMQKICNEAMIYYKKGEIEKAINLFTQAANNNYLPAIKNITSHYLLKTDETCDIGKYILKLTSCETDAIAMRNVGLYKFIKEQYFDALQFLKKAENLGCPDLNYRIALCHMSLSDYKSAIKLFRTIELEELTAIDCFCACNCLELNLPVCSCDPACKINYLKLVDQTKFNNLRNLAIKVYNCMGQCYKNLEQYLTAIEYFEKSLNKGNVAILFELYYCHFKLGNLYFASTLVQKIKESRNKIIITKLINNLHEDNLITVLFLRLQLIFIIIEDYNNETSYEKKLDLRFEFNEEKNKLKDYFYKHHSEIVGNNNDVITIAKECLIFEL